MNDQLRHRRGTQHEKAAWAVGVCALIVTLTGCAPESSGPMQTTAATAPDAASEPEPTSEPEASAEAKPQPQEETCDWDSPAAAGGTDAPSGQEGDISTVLVGAWQHTHYDTGAGFEAVDNDIRYIFPSAERILYCQHVPGVTEYAENAANFTLNGTSIDLPGAPGYEVSAWDDDTMLWINRADDSTYLLQRR